MVEFHNSESLALSYLRVLALTLIVTCHILQALDNKWAWVLNIGVQIFFFLSGYLYGHKVIENWHEWYMKRAQKIYIPFIVTAVAWMMVYKLTTNTCISFVNVIVYASNVQWFVGGVKGLGHLWFVTAIMLCYFITPVLQTFKSNSSHACIVLLFYSMLEFYFAQYAIELFMALFIYTIGYLFANLSTEMQKAVTILFVLFAIYILYWLDWTHVLQYNSLPNRLFHTYVGITFSILFILLLWKVVKIKHRSQLISVLDKYSYETYLVHHPLILGSLTLIGLTDYLTLNIFLIFLFTLFLSYGLKKLSSAILANLMI